MMRTRRAPAAGRVPTAQGQTPGASAGDRHHHGAPVMLRGPSVCPTKVKTVSAAGDLRGCEAVGGIQRVEEA